MEVVKIKTIPDEEILRLILSGEITARRIKSHDPIIIHRGRELKASIINGRRNHRYRIEICRPKRPRQKRVNKRTIVRSKLVWMIHHRQLVPDGHELHHKDEDRFNDSANNIIARTHEDHFKDHYGPF